MPNNRNSIPAADVYGNQDPTLVATNGNPGFLFYKLSIPSGLYEKNDAGLTTNWTLLSGGAAGVASLNALAGALAITAGSGISVTPAGSNIAVAVTRFTPVVSASSGNFSTGSAVNVDVTNLSVTITTTGRPVILFMTGDGVTAPARMGCLSVGGMILELLRGATSLIQTQIVDGSALNLFVPPSCFQYMDVVPAGTYTYKMRAAQSGGGTVQVVNSVLVAYELA